MINKFLSACLALFCICVHAHAQNPLQFPPLLTGTVFNLNIQTGTQSFYTGTNTPTYGINGALMAPTIMVNKGDSITLNVHNGLNVQTTMHWHGMHVAAKNDGGPHQMIMPGSTWSPTFTVRNNAGTFWYHPHGAGQTDPHVSKGLDGFILVKDSAEATLNIPRTYGVDDIPLNIQSKSFDILQQIAIATQTDTALFVNGIIHPYFDAPAQVIRLRLLNGSSMRTYQFGFSNGQTFYQIATDGGMLDTAVTLNRLRLAPGERAEILVNFSGMQGQQIHLKSYASELPIGIYGASSVGFGQDTIPDYATNFLNGIDFDILQIHIAAPTSNPITTIITTLLPLNNWNTSSANVHRQIDLDTIRNLPFDTPNLAEGPFGINQKTFDMDSINAIVYLNDVEIWTLKNHTLVAHPFHIHDVQFNVIERSGMPPPANERGWKDVVLVMPNDSVKFITKFTDFADNNTPYMYHCHLLHHEDDGMMGSFLVMDTAASVGIQEQSLQQQVTVYPNPTSDYWTIKSEDYSKYTTWKLYNAIGQCVESISCNQLNSMPKQLGNTAFPSGIYFLQMTSEQKVETIKLMKQ